MAASVKANCPEIIFAYLMGSSRDGEVAAHSDLDIAVLLEEPIKDVLKTHRRLCDALQPYVPGVRVDIGSLNKADPVYRFEALRGQLLFTRDQNIWLDFYSRTCREYEDQLIHYRRQHAYRMEVA